MQPTALNVCKPDAHLGVLQKRKKIPPIRIVKIKRMRPTPPPVVPVAIQVGVWRRLLLWCVVAVCCLVFRVCVCNADFVVWCWCCVWYLFCARNL